MTTESHSLIQSRYGGLDEGDRAAPVSDTDVEAMKTVAEGTLAEHRTGNFPLNGMQLARYVVCLADEVMRLRRREANVLSLIDVAEAADALLVVYNGQDVQPFELWQQLAAALGRFA